MVNSILQQLNLDSNQILIYEYLLKNGASRASQIAKNTPLKRGLVYKVLDELIELQIIEKDEPEGAVSIFIPLHPSALKSLAESKVRAAQNAQNHLDDEIGSLVSMYNLANNKPGIEFYEGIDGVKKVLKDSLTSSEKIYTILDTETIDTNVATINNSYVKERLKKGIAKNILTIDTPNAFKIAEQETNKLTTYKILEDHSITKLYAIMQIYDNKIAYITYKKDTLTSTIITDKSIYEMHRHAFEYMWDKAKKIN